ncbi:MAG: hypothetical protein ACXVLQ_11670 [Bacteriovorax sp.]
MTSEPREYHPYGAFFSTLSESLILGSFPIGKFTNPKRRKEIKPHEIDFNYGGEGNQLWPLLGMCFGLKLDTKEKILAFLEEKNFSVADIIKSCRRKKGRGSDADLYDIEWNKDLHGIIAEKKFKKIYFTSRGVRDWYVRHIGRVEGPEEIILLSPSANGVRSFPKLSEYKEWEKTVTYKNKAQVFRELFYKKIFKG